MPADPSRRVGRSGFAFWYALVSAPFFLNDFNNIFTRDFERWLFTDYLMVKVLPFALLFYLLRSGKISLEDVGLKKIPWKTFAVLAVVMAAAGTAVEFAGRKWLPLVLPSFQTGGIPWDPQSPLAKFDLIFGLVTVGIFEEVIFTGMGFAVFRKHDFPPWAAAACAAALFGLIHWSLGAPSVVKAFLFGMLFMIPRARTGSVLPLILAHFWVDYGYFSGLTR